MRIRRRTPGGNNRPKRVTETGLAVVHENELVYPAAGSEARAVEIADDGSGATLLFSAELEVVHAPPDGEAERVANELLDQTSDILNGMS